MTDRANRRQRLGRTDIAVLHQLQQDGRLTNQILADRVFASESTSSRHRRELEADGVITGYIAVVDEQQVGYSVAAFVTVSLRSLEHAAKEAFEAAVGRIDQVMECHSIAGDHDYILRVIARDLRDYKHLVERIEEVPETEHVHSSLVLKEAFRKREVPL